MDHDGFRSFMQDRKLPEDAFGPALDSVAQFEAFLQQRATGERTSEETRHDLLRQAGPDELEAFVAQLISARSNRREDILAIARYGWFVENDALYVAAVELLDGSEVLDNLYRRLGEELGAERRGRVFADHPPPPLGTPNHAKPPITQTVTERLLETVGPHRCAAILGEGLRTLSDEAHHPARESYRQLGSLDAYLEQRAADFIGQLEEARAEKRLWFTQPITPEVASFVRDNPEIASAVRQGSALYKTKIPYMTDAYLRTTEKRLRRYYYCHCPWVRESLRTESADVPPVWCNCSAAFVKKPYEVIFGQPLKAEILETVLTGGRWCRFVIHLPAGIA